jgi:hypothetical protein
MKEFDVEAAKAGYPVCDIEGTPVRVAHYDTQNNMYHIMYMNHNRGSWATGKDLRMLTGNSRR